MNITDVKAPSEIPDDIIRAIFQKQLELIEKYHVIEKKNGFPVFEFPVNLHDKHAQAKLKDFAWRMTEEFTESTDAHSFEHKLEEVIDALHFFVELNILCGHYPEVKWERSEYLMGHDYHTYRVIERVGCAMNCLKNKPWKQSNMLTDTEKFHRHLEEAWHDFFLLFDSYNISIEDVYVLYFKKATVNTFRQRSNY